MKKYLLIIFTFHFLISFSQVSTKLDEKKGFKEFILGDSFSKWSSKLNLIANKGDYKKYIYIGKCCQTVFNYNVYKIELEFKLEKLVNIYITLDQWEEPNETRQYTDISNCLYEIKKLATQFSILFGENSEYIKDDEKTMITYGWYGNKVGLTCSMEYQGYKSGCESIIIIGELTSYSNGF